MSSWLWRFILLVGLAPWSTVVGEEFRDPRRDAPSDALPARALARLGTTRFRTEGFTHPLALSPDGKRIALKCQPDELCLLDAATGLEVRRFSDDRIGTRYLAFSPD